MLFCHNTNTNDKTNPNYPLWLKDSAKQLTNFIGFSNGMYSTSSIMILKTCLMPPLQFSYYFRRVKLAQWHEGYFDFALRDLNCDLRNRSLFSTKNLQSNHTPTNCWQKIKKAIFVQHNSDILVSFGHKTFEISSPRLSTPVPCRRKTNFCV